MPTLPILKGETLKKILDKVDFVVVRQRGSHVRMRRERDGKVVTVPIHPSRDIDRGLLHKIIIVDLEWTTEYFIELYHKYR